MKKALVVVSVLALLATVSTSAFAERWGKPGANLAKGQSSLGLEYNYIEEELDFKPPQGVTLPFDAIYDEHQAVRNQLLVRVGYGLTDQLEAFIKLGGTSTKVDEAFLSSSGFGTIPGALEFNQDLEGNMEFTIVGGLAATLLQSGDFRLGTVGQFTYFNTDDTGEAFVYPGFTLNQGIDANVFRFEGALLASYTLGKFTPYGGICMLITDSDARYRAYSTAATPFSVLDIDLDQEDWFGGVCGINCTVMDNVRVGIELTGVSEGVGLSTGVTVAL